MSSERPRPKPELPESLRGGVYANFFSISVSKSEAVVDFGIISPDPRTGAEKPGEDIPRRNQIVSRVIMSRDAIEKFHDLLTGVLKPS